MSEAWVITPEDAQIELRTMRITRGGIPGSLHEAYAHTVATEPDRIAEAERRGAVKVLRNLAAAHRPYEEFADEREKIAPWLDKQADAIERGEVSP